MERCDSFTSSPGARLCCDGSLDIVQRLGLLKKLPIHNGCVNCICWSDNGDLLLSGSDDQHLVVSHAYTYKTLTDYKTSHRANVFSAKFLPCSGDKNIVSCSGDGIILFTDLVRPSDTHNCQFNCHTGTTYEVATIPGDPHTFLSCGEDYTVRCFDLRIKESCNKADCQEDVLISGQRAVTALTINNMAPHQLAIGCSDSTVRLFDRRMLGTKSSGHSKRSGVRPVLAVAAPGLEGKSYRITSLAFSPEGEDILVSYSSEHLYLFSTLDQNNIQILKQDNCGNGVGEESDGGGDNCGEMDDTKVPVVGLPPIRRLRLRGDWSDTGPDARPEREPGRSGDVAQARPTLHATLMQRMTDVLSRMLNDPATRAALSNGGDDDPESFNDSDNDHEHNLSANLEQQDIDMEQDHEHVHDEPVNYVEIAQEPEPLGGVDPLWSMSEPTIQPVSVDAATTSGNENVTSLPSFESTYSSYSHVKSPAVSQQSQTTSTVPCSSSTEEIEQLVPQPQSSASTSTSDAASSSNPTDSNSASDQSLKCLTDQLSTMRHGFIEKHGTEPMVNLHYSDKGPTASRITMSVGDELNRQVDSTTSPDGASTTVKANVPLNNTSPVASSSCQAGRSSGSLENSSQSTDIPHSGSSSSSNIGATLPPQSTPVVVEQMSEDDESVFNSDDETNSHVNTSMSNQSDKNINLDSSSSQEIQNKGELPNASATEQPCSSSESSTSFSLHETLKLQTPLKQKYTGHRNARTMIKEATFWGTNYVLSGSDCGHVFVWDRFTARLVMLLEADHHVVNCIQPHPQLPILATSGIDYDVKLWAPVHEESAFDLDMAEELMKRNEVMLEETKDTITVPASFMIRMLACLNQIRRRRSRRRHSSQEGTSNNSD